MTSVSDKKGFTLIEVLVAVTIIAVIVLSIYSAFNTGITAYKKMDTAFSSFQDARIILNVIETDLKNSFIYSEESSFFKGGSSALDFFSILNTYDKDEKYNSLCRIKYTLEGNTLKRTVYGGFAALGDDENAQAQELSNSIEKIDFEYAYIGSGDDKAIIWRNVWPQKDNQTGQLPLAVKIKLSLAGADSDAQESVEFTKTISLVQANISGSEEN